MTGLDSLASELYIQELQSSLSKADNYQLEFVENIGNSNHKVVTMNGTEIVCLTWKQSYFASLEDSKRISITYEVKTNYFFKKENY